MAMGRRRRHPTPQGGWRIQRPGAVVCGGERPHESGGGGLVLEGGEGFDEGDAEGGQVPVPQRHRHEVPAAQGGEGMFRGGGGMAQGGNQRPEAHMAAD